MYLDLRKGITFYNDNREPRTVKMSQDYLGELSMPDKSKSTRISYMSHWANEKKFSTLTVEIYVRMCDILGVDYDYMICDTDNLDSMDDTLLIDLMKFANKHKQTPNEAIGYIAK